MLSEKQLLVENKDISSYLLDEDIMMFDLVRSIALNIP